MKKISLLLIATISVIKFSYAQTNTFPSSGNVGIGTNAPAYLLDAIKNQAGYTYINVSNNNTAASGTGEGYIMSEGGTITGVLRTERDGSGAMNLSNSGNGPIYLGTGTSITTTTPKLTVLTGGNVGIGTTSPGEKLQVDGNIYVVKGGGSTLYLANSNYVSYISSVENGGFSDLSLAAHNTERIRILGSNGNVGIGTTTPDAKLTVNGTTHTKEVLVDMSIYPDYVFKPTYHLPTLTEVKTYINQNHHLPDMPTEAEVVKNGLKVGETEALLTKKVEELTLYLIDKDKQVNTLQDEVQQLKQQVNLLINKSK